MATEDGGLSFTVASVMEDVLQQHGNGLGDHDLEYRRAEEAASRRYEAANWLRKMVGVVGAKDLPAEPTEEGFRLGLRSGIILCKVLNKVQPGAVSKVVESPCDALLVADGAPLSAFQYFENVRNFLVAIQEMGFPTFEASDLEQGGNASRVVNCVLAIKSYDEWKQSGGNGVWKFGGNIKPPSFVKSSSIVRKNSEPFMNSLSRTSSINNNEKSLSETDSNKLSNSGSLSTLVRAVLSDKRPEDVPKLIETLLSKVVQEFEHRVTNQYELVRASPRESSTSSQNNNNNNNRTFLKPLGERDVREEESFEAIKQKEETIQKSQILFDEEMKNRQFKQVTIFNQQQEDIQGLRQTLYTTRAGMQFMQKKFHQEFSSLGMHIHGLAHAASGYHRVLEENRKLYNQVQDLKGSIRVYCRVRPFLPGQSSFSSSIGNMEDGTISINTPSRHGKSLKSFTFNKVFGPSASQEEVFSDMQPLIRSVLDGYNVCIFAYGQTGSGKTYTMSGPRDLTEKSEGVNYRALGDLFLLAEQRKDTFRYDIAVQMIEIYNEQVRDLLVVDGCNKRLEIRNSSAKGLSVPDASLVPVSSTFDVIDLMKTGHKNRAVGSTALNDRSSRSHSCLTVHVQGRDLTSGAVLRGCMHLVDLAGSERVDKSEVTGDRLKEAQHINKSLSALGDVIASLAHKNPHVPYRNSKLTQLLQDSLGGQAKTLMFVHISPEVDAVGETMSTLKFAERVATVELGAARVNNNDTSDVKELKEQIATLKAALLRKEAESHQNKTPSSEKHKAKTVETEIHAKKSESCEVEEIIVNSPPWPPIPSPGQTYRDEDRSFGSSEWVDKVMVNNRQDEMRRIESLWGGGGGEDLISSDASRIFSEHSYNIFMGQDLDAATSDSSEADLLWQFNQASKIESKPKKPVSKPVKSPPFRNSNTTPSRPSPSQKLANGGTTRGTKQIGPTDMKRKATVRH